MKRMTDFLFKKPIDEQIFENVWDFRNQLYNVFNENKSNISDKITENNITLYKGELKLAKFLTHKLLKDKSNFTIVKDKLKHFQNIFFDEIEINITDKPNSGYKSHKEKLEKYDVIISVNKEYLTANNYERLLSLFCHELKHAWQDYIDSISKSKNFLYELTSSKEYKDAIQNLNPTGRNLEKTIASHIYYKTIEVEKDAFKAELEGHLEGIFKNVRPNSLKESLEAFRKSDVFNDIYSTYKIINDVNNNVVEVNIEKINLYINEFAKTNKSLDKNFIFYEKHLRKLFTRLCNIAANFFWEKKREISLSEAMEIHISPYAINKLNFILYEIGKA